MNASTVLPYLPTYPGLACFEQLAGGVHSPAGQAVLAAEGTFAALAALQYMQYNDIGARLRAAR